VQIRHVAAAGREEPAAPRQAAVVGHLEQDARTTSCH
jgi:hypothetical protein